MIFEKNGNTVEVTDPNCFSIFEREGFTVVEKDIEKTAEKSELLKIAKELGIKSAHLMGIEKLKEEIEKLK